MPTATQMVVHLLRSFEHSLVTNAGLGANLTEEGRVECEITIVCGRTNLVGCCGTVSGVKEPSALALKLLEQAEKVNDGSDLSGKFVFGRQPPLVIAGKYYQVTTRTREHWEKWHRRFQEAVKIQTEGEEDEQLDTVGSVCMDSIGSVAAALSSGGVAYKVPGRMGLAGCPRMGCNAANAVAMMNRKRKRKRIK
ncbi:unnamed protein product [Peronospora belbahrii]|uniref:Uncharacterized protein n=1 Tax=Peronospora belbahrii TaxID=622444 RepID=A0AAU9LEY3_9STRA|nr:unnamed protein product [Peronospora belbahrii]